MNVDTEHKRYLDASRRADAYRKERNALKTVAEALAEQVFKTAEILEAPKAELDGEYRSFLARQLRAALEHYEQATVRR